MKKREQIEHMFSSFMIVDDRTDSLNRGWQTDKSLRNSMRTLLTTEPELSEEDCAQFWLQQVIQDRGKPLASNHLCAYLEESCCFATLQVFQQFRQFNIKRVDCFFYAREAAANPQKLFKRYDPGQKTRLKTYAQYPLKSAILERVRIGSELLKYSPPTLMRTISKKRFTEVLRNAHLSKTKIDSCLLFQQCFRDRYSPPEMGTNRKLPPPTLAQWKAIASDYNQRRREFDLTEAVTEKDMENLFNFCTTLVRDSLKIRMVSWEESQNVLELNQTVPPETEESLTEESRQIREFLVTAFSQQSSDCQNWFKLWMGLGFTQTEIAIALGWNPGHQYKISRAFRRCQTDLLKALVLWIQERFNTTLTPEQMQAIAPQINECLEQYCQGEFHRVLQQTVTRELATEVDLLTTFYGKGSTLEVVADLLAITVADVEARVKTIKQHLQTGLQSYIEQTLAIDLAVVSRASHHLETFIDRWLLTAPYATFRR